jgi:hypothetical protein
MAVDLPRRRVSGGKRCAMQYESRRAGWFDQFCYMVDRNIQEPNIGANANRLQFPLRAYRLNHQTEGDERNVNASDGDFWNFFRRVSNEWKFAIVYS